MNVNIINEKQTNILIYIAQNARICTNNEAYITQLNQNHIIFNDEANEKALNTVESLLNRGHHSVFECIYIEWYIRNISRASANQLVRHRMASYLQQSQRYVNYMESEDFWNNMVIPNLSYITNSGNYNDTMEIINTTLKAIKKSYNDLIKLGIKAEDARSILPQCSPTTIKVGMNLREFLFNFYPLRSSKHAQEEIRLLANKMFDNLKEKYFDDKYFQSFLNTYLKWLKKHKEYRNEWK